MITCKELKDQQFATTAEMIKALVANKGAIIALKKSAMKTTDAVAFTSRPVIAIKSADGTFQVKQLSIGDTLPVVINTTNYLDSHNDVHLAGIWNKSAKDQDGHTYHVINHDLNLGSIVGYPKDVRIEIRPMKWQDLGVQVDGDTEALIFHTKMTEKTNTDAFLAYRDGEDVQHSIRMAYVDLFLAVNDPEMKEEYANFQKYLPQIMNKDKALEQGYFWGVPEAKISKEGSTVLFGSNDMTPALNIQENKSTILTPPTGTTVQPQNTFDLDAAIKEIKLF